MSDRFDAAIIGGGPAGSATALALRRRGLNVVVLERSRYENWRAGETLPPEVCVPLDQLGAWDRFVDDGHLPSFAIQSAWGSGEIHENHSLLNPHGNGWHIDRRRFDAMLARAAEDNGSVVWRGARAVSIEDRSGRWRIKASHFGKLNEFEATVIVDATGREARIARERGSISKSYDRLIGIAALIKPKESGVEPDPVLMLEAAPDGWWYAAPVPSGDVLVTYMTDSDYLSRGRMSAAEFWNTNLQQTTHMRGLCDRFHRPASAQVLSSSTVYRNPVCAPGWFAVGDAASAWDPLSAAGIGKALQSGYEAAQAIEGFLAGRIESLNSYAASVETNFQRYLMTRVSYYRREVRWAERPFWRRRHQQPARQNLANRYQEIEPARQSATQDGSDPVPKHKTDL